MGWCGLASPLVPQRSHTFHPCIKPLNSVRLPQIRPNLRDHLPLCMCMGLVRQSFFVAFVVPNAGPTCNLINAAAALMQLLGLLPHCMSPNWPCILLIQVPQLRAQLFRLVPFLPLRHPLLPPWGCLCRNGCGWYPPRTVRLGPRRSSFLLRCAGLR